MRGSGFLIAVLGLASVVGCERLERAIGERHGPVWAENEAPETVGVEGSERWIEGLDFVAVDGESFSVVSRRGRLVQAPCTGCHDGSIGTVGEGRTRRAHWQIERPHGQANELSCGSCHSTEGPVLLRTIHEAPVDFDQAHRLCGTCHHEALEDWKGGAHGKRVGAWAGERIVEPCTGCHDPHEPSFPVRLPTTFSPQPPGEEGAFE